jgi:hypothetical protein
MALIFVSRWSLGLSEITHGFPSDTTGTRMTTHGHMGSQVWPDGAVAWVPLLSSQNFLAISLSFFHHKADSNRSCHFLLSNEALVIGAKMATRPIFLVTPTT